MLNVFYTISVASFTTCNIQKKRESNLFAKRGQLAPT